MPPLMSRNIASVADRSPLFKSKILSEIEIEKLLGAGGYGAVFSIKDSNRAFKVFRDGVSLQKDIDRIEKVMDQVYKGTASESDAHYFDYGKLSAGSDLYYAIMPKIIPIQNLPIFKEYEGFVEDIFYILDDQHYGNNANEADFCHKVKAKFTQILLDKISEERREGNRQNVEDLTEKYNIGYFNSFINSVSKAFWRAKEEFDGTDLHSGNIGAWQHKPDVFVFFDM